MSIGMAVSFFLGEVVYGGTENVRTFGFIINISSTTQRPGDMIR